MTFTSSTRLTHNNQPEGNVKVKEHAGTERSRQRQLPSPAVIANCLISTMHTARDFVAPEKYPKALPAPRGRIPKALSPTTKIYRVSPATLPALPSASQAPPRRQTRLCHITSHHIASQSSPQPLLSGVPHFLRF